MDDRRDDRGDGRVLPLCDDNNVPGPKSNTDPSTLADVGLDAGPTAGGTPGEEARSVNNVRVEPDEPADG